MFRRSLIKIAGAPSVAGGLATCSSSGSSTASGSNAAAARFRRADRHDDGRRHRQADLRVPPARLGLRLLKAVRRQHGPGHRAERGIGALQNHRVAYAIATHHGVVQNQGIGTSVSNLAFTAGSQQWMGGLPGGRAGWRRLGPSHQAVVQKVVDALAASMHWIGIRTANKLEGFTR